MADIGVTDEFLALGGQSLLATRIVVRVNEACQVDLPLEALLALPTVEQMAVAVTQAWLGRLPPDEAAAALRTARQARADPVAETPGGPSRPPPPVSAPA